MKKKTKIVIFSIVLIISLLVISVGGFFFCKINSAAFAIDKPSYIYIDENKDYKQVLTQLDATGHIQNLGVFKLLSKQMKYPENIKSGRYEITPHMSYLEAVRTLRNGQQAPVKLTFNNVRLKSDFIKRVSSQFIFSEEELAALLSDSTVVDKLGFDTTTILTLFIPNTYEMYWNTSADKFLARMKKEYNRFWTRERLKKAANLSLTPIEVSILASIVEEETANRAEYPMVAGLYLNRLRKGMALQADPTVKFAVGDVSLRRILFEHLKVESPYNTYKHTGLPPGPIRVPSIQGIDGVLNATQHTYLYMCAKEDFSGTHNFAVTLAEHSRNAKKYQAVLNKLKIKN
ncbi:MAG: endolytic transglycosylase MltG [Candidatus Symbiothrix sp.]|jgi:UPF0755 protein|nr:endolytic transglycosylase MltG [Candidatus Symbiothrix sp.]